MSPQARRSLVAGLYGAPIGTLGGLIGLGGAEFRLPVLRAVFGYETLRAVALNLAISTLALVASLVARLPATPAEQLVGLAPVLAGIVAGAVVGAAWGAGYARHLSRERLERLILILLVGVGGILIAEGFVPLSRATPLHGPVVVPVAMLLGTAIGMVSSLLGVAGGELIIPTLVLIFGADMRVAGTASVIISLPMTLVGVMRYARMGVYAKEDGPSIIVPMGAGSVIGALIGGRLTSVVPSNLLKVALGAILIVSGIRIFRHRKTLRIASTTSVLDSGILPELLRAFRARTGCHTLVKPVGSGKAIEMLVQEAADVAVTHAPGLEEEARARGSVLRRTPFMANRYVLVAPAAAAGVTAGAADAAEAMRRIAASGWRFVSRGDRSGTHQQEISLWTKAGVADPSPLVTYARRGMLATIRLAARERAFTLTDVATFLSHHGGLDLVIVYEGNGELHNVYALLESAKASDPPALATAWSDFLRSPEGRSVIEHYRAGTSSESLYVPVAG